jgi:MFS family permease
MTRKGPLYGWLASEAISLTGTRVSMIALPWFVLTTTGSATLTGLVAFAEMLPMVLLKVFGGPLIDRVGARRISIACDLLSVLAVGAIPMLHLLDALNLPVFLGLVAVAGALRGPGDAAKRAMVPALVESAGVPMGRATGLSSSVERTASMLGAAVAGGLVAVIGPANALVVDAASFLLSAAVLAWTTRSLARPVVVAQGSPGTPTQTPAGYLAQLREGWRFLRGDRLLFGITVMVALTNFLDIAWATVLVPVWAQEFGGGAAAIGLMFAVLSGASVLGSISAAAWEERLPRFTVYLVAFLITGVPRFAILGFDVPMWSVLSVTAAAGFASGFINPVLGAVTFERIPAPLVGRVTSLSAAMCFALMPFGGIAGGVLTQALGLTAAMLVAGVAYLLVTMVPAMDPTWRELDRRPAPQGSATADATATPSPAAG